MSNRKSSRRSRRRSRHSSSRKNVIPAAKSRIPQVSAQKTTDHPEMPETFIYTCTIYKTAD